MKRQVLLSAFLLLLLSCQQTPEDVQHEGITYVPMETKRLPDMNEPRRGHALGWAGDHILAVGGHNTGFVRSLLRNTLTADAGTPYPPSIRMTRLLAWC